MTDAIERNIDKLWLRVKPGLAAQSIRANLARTPELMNVEDDMPDWVWGLIDIGAQMAIEAERKP